METEWKQKRWASTAPWEIFGRGEKPIGAANCQESRALPPPPLDSRAPFDNREPPPPSPQPQQELCRPPPQMTSIDTQVTQTWHWTPVVLQGSPTRPLRITAPPLSSHAYKRGLAQARHARHTTGMLSPLWVY